MSDSLQPHGLQHTRLPCPSPSPGACSNSCPLSQWCHPTILSSVIPFSSCLQSIPASESFPVSQLLASAGQNIGASASASVPSMNIQDRFHLGWTGWISLESKGLSRVFSNTIWGQAKGIQKLIKKIIWDGNGNTLQYSCLGNFMDRWAWQSTVHRVAKSQMWLSD